MPLGLHEAGSDADAVGGVVDKHYMEVIDVDDAYRSVSMLFQRYLQTHAHTQTS